MSAPSQVLIKRKRDDSGPDTLLLEMGNKRAHNNTTANPLQYVRIHAGGGAQSKGEKGTETVNGSDVGAPTGQTERQNGAGRRVFRLTKTRRTGNNDRQKHHEGASTTVAPIGMDVDLATFQEQRVDTAADRPSTAGSDDEFKVQKESRVFKRPGRKTAVPTPQTASAQVRGFETQASRKHIEMMAASLHHFALDELSAMPKKKLTAEPKFPGRRRKVELQPMRVADPHKRHDEMELDSDTEYVYDKYILAPADPTLHPTESVNNQPGNGIGYLIITDEDQSLWETYIEDDASDNELDSDDADSNAEDYYGADYPEDELASDDEYDRGAYDYRKHGASDDESWDEDTGAFSGDEQDVDPWRTKTYGRFTQAAGGEIDDAKD